MQRRLFKVKTSKFEAHSHVFVEKQNKNVAKIYLNPLVLKRPSADVFRLLLLKWRCSSQQFLKSAFRFLWLTYPCLIQQFLDKHHSIKKMFRGHIGSFIEKIRREKDPHLKRKKQKTSKPFLPKIAEGVHEVTFSIRTNRNSPASDPSTEFRRAAANAIQVGPSNNLTGKSQSWRSKVAKG